jgi:hypothetical protein
MSKQNLLGKESLADRMQQIKKEMHSPTDNDIEKQEEAINKPAHAQKSAKETPKLFVSGRLDRKKHSYTPKSLILLTQLENEIKTYCRGGDLVVLNYLIKVGLEQVKASETIINVDMVEISSNII